MREDEKGVYVTVADYRKALEMQERVPEFWWHDLFEDVPVIVDGYEKPKTDPKKHGA